MTRPPSPQWIAAATLALALLPAAGHPARKAPPAPAPAGALDPSLLRGLSFRLVGPFRGGRVTAVAGVPGEPRTFYMGSTGGGVWKTTDGGANWRNVSDKRRAEKAAPPPAVMGEVDRASALGQFFQPSRQPPPPPTDERPGDAFGTASVGAIAVAPSDPNVVYVGMGSACIRGNVSAGDGVYKSVDGGESWHHVGLADAGQIAAIRVHATNPDLVYAAVLGHAFGPNPERGVFRSTDGGRAWRKVLFVSDRAGAVDLEMDARNPRVLYAATWEAVRQPWTMISGGPGSGVYKSGDGGDTWRKLAEGLPAGALGRIGLAVSPAAPNRVWALLEHKEKWGLYRSDDGGDSFRLLTSDRNLVQRAWYYTHVFADPKNPSVVYVLNTAMYRSEDGGKTFLPIRTPHGDNHALWIDPDDPRVMIEGNDGGANVSSDGGRTWSTQANQPTAEIYRVTVDDQFPYWLYGGQQDNTTVAIPSRAPGSGIDRTDWYTPGGCESGYVAVDPRDPNVTYAGCYGGSIGRYDRRIGHQKDVSPWPQEAVGHQAKDLRYRFQWNHPIRLSPHDPATLYTTSNVVHRSRDGGQTWEVISPDLTRNDKNKQAYAGGEITLDNTGVEVYDTIFAFEESPLTAGELWAGSDDGLVHVSRDAGAHWEDVTPKGMPEWATVNAIEISGRHPGRVYVAAHRYRLDDFHPYLFRSDDGGKSWTLLTDGRNGIPADFPTRVVREDPARDGLLFAGTERGLFVSFDDGARWQPFQLDLPLTPVTDLAVKSGDLVVATQGRSFWILDDLTPLEQAGAAAGAPGTRLYPPRPAHRFLGGGGFGISGRAVGKNPPDGAVVDYQLPSDLEGEGKQEVRLEILDADGRVLRSLSSQQAEPTAPNPYARFFPELIKPRKLPAKAGLNRFVWDLRLPDAFVVPDAILWGDTSGPRVPPGAYQVRLTMGDFTATQPVRVLADPRGHGTPEGFAEQYRLARGAWEALSRAHHAVSRIRDVRGQVEAVAKRLKGAGLGEGVADPAKALADKLTAVEESLHNPKIQGTQDMLNYPPQLDDALGYLMGALDTAEGAPTEAQRQLFAELSQRLDTQLAALDQALSTDLPAFNQLVGARNAPAVIVPKEEAPSSR